MAVATQERTLGTTAVARVLGCSPAHVARLVDSRELLGFRRPNRRADVVVRQRDLVRFCRQHQIPLDGLGLVRQIVVVGAARAFTERLAAVIGSGWAVHTSANLLSAGILIQQYQPDAVVLDAALGGGDTRLALAVLAELVRQRVVLMNEDDNAGDYVERPALALFRKPVDDDRVANYLRTRFEPEAA